MIWKTGPRLLMNKSLFISESSDIKLLGANIYETFCTKESQQQPGMQQA